jgi:hypothetical protein
MSDIPSNCGPITKDYILEKAKINGKDILTHSHITHVHKMFCRLAYQPALQFLWVLVIEARKNKEYLLNRIGNSVKTLEPEGWDTKRIISHTWTEDTQDIIGCIFAQGVNLPGETIKTEYVGIKEGSNRGFLNAPIINGRTDYEPMEIGFLETNQSFADGLLRPWSILVAHEGLLAKSNPIESIKADIHVYQLARAGGDTIPNIVRKHWIFKECAPIYISSEELTYASSNDYGKRQVKFAYNSYHLIGSMDNTDYKNSSQKNYTDYI